MLAVFATSIWWLDILKKAAALRGVGDFFAFLWVDVLAVAALAVVSVWIERRRLAREWTAAPPCGLAFHRFAAWAIVATLLLTTGAGLIADLMSDSFGITPLLAWAAWFAAAIVATACLWDPAHVGESLRDSQSRLGETRPRGPVACLYCVGLIAVGMYLDGLDLHAPLFHWALANALAAYSLATSGLWSVRDKLRAVAARLGVPTAASGSLSETADFASRRDAATWLGGGHGWLVSPTFSSAIGVLLLVTWIELTMPSFTSEWWPRMRLARRRSRLACWPAARCGLRCNTWRSVGRAVCRGVWLGLAAARFRGALAASAGCHGGRAAAVVVVYGFGLVKFLSAKTNGRGPPSDSCRSPVWRLA